MEKKKILQVALSRVRRLSNLRLVGGIAPAALAADGGGGGGARTSSSLSSSLSAPSSSSSLSLFSRGGDGDSYGGVDELAVSDSYGSEQTGALESSRGGGGGSDGREEEEAWGAAVADAAACRPAKKKKRLAERGGLAIDF